MSVSSKYRLAHLASLLAILAIAYCFWRVIPPGMSGDAHQVKLWIGLTFIVSSAGVACALAMYYYRAKLQETDNGKVAVTALGKVGAKQQQPNGATTRKTRQKSV